MTKFKAQYIFSVACEAADELYFVEGRKSLRQYCLAKMNDDFRFVLYDLPLWNKLASISNPEDLFDYFQGGRA